jgi:hypothetical protein
MQVQILDGIRMGRSERRRHDNPKPIRIETYAASTLAANERDEPREGEPIAAKCNLEVYMKALETMGSSEREVQLVS